MHLPRSFKLILAAVCAASSFGVHAAEPWAPVATKAPSLLDTVSGNAAVPGAAMQAGSSVHVVLTLQVRNKAGLDALTASVAQGNAAPLSSAQFLSQYAPTPAQVQLVTNYLTTNGFVNVTVADNNLLVSADGTAASVTSAFNTNMQTYTYNGRAAFANTSDVAVPQSLSGIVLAVHGLQTLHQHHIMAKRLAGAGTASGHMPTDFPLIYNASSLPSASNAVIGIITQGSMTQTITDLKSFASSAGFPSVNVTTVIVGSSSTDTSGIDEWNLDTQDSLAAAGGTIKQMILYTAPTLNDSDLTAAYNKAVSDNTAKVINISLGECESDAQSSGIMASNDQIFQTAVAQGQTFSVSSGDSGAYECGGTTTAQSYPAVSPYVMAIGGTLLNTTGTTWASETVWSCTSSSNCQQSASGGAGGGPSLTETAPSWQQSSGVLGSSTKRGVPDIALDASPNSGALVLINGSDVQIGGTSLAAPLFTGFWARVQSMNNNALAFPATAIYQKAASTPNMFHDITSGSNGGYSAKSGWDYASGYGSLNVANFASALGTSGGTTTTTAATTSTTTGATTTSTGKSTTTTTAHTTTSTRATTTTTSTTTTTTASCPLYFWWCWF